MTEEDFTLNKGLEIIKNSKNNIILFGPVGEGKTTILNKICGQNFKTSNGYFSTTNEVHYAYSIKYNNIVIDFPGLHSEVNKVEKIKVQKNALSVIPIKMICFIVRYSPRYDNTLKSVSQMLQIFQEYRKNICLIISNSEKSTITYRAEIEHIFRIKFGINKIILSTLEINELELLDKIEKFKEDMPFIKNLNLKTSDLIRIIEPKFDLDFIDDRENYINEFQNGLKIFLEELSKATEKDLKRALYFGLRDFKDNLIKKYAEIIKGKKADNDKIITELIMLNNTIFDQFIRFKEKVEPELDTQTKDLNGEYIRYKKCPNCGIIWFLLCGSQNTLCGARSNALDIIYGKYIEYSVKFINGIITIQKIEIENKNTNTEKKRLGLTEEEKLENQKRGGKALIKPIGCGSELKWSEMEDVTDQVLKHLKEIYDNYDNVIIDISKEFNINL